MFALLGGGAGVVLVRGGRGPGAGGSHAHARDAELAGRRLVAVVLEVLVVGGLLLVLLHLAASLALALIQLPLQDAAHLLLHIRPECSGLME